jgi:hypothetical protein
MQALYFAYGSNLCASRLCGRFPGLPAWDAPGSPAGLT